MGKITMITGGVRSGKSSYGESLFSSDDVLYIATNQFYDNEMKLRIEKHRETRNKHWTLLEAYKDLGEIISNKSETNFFLDCITALITNFLFESEHAEDLSLDEYERIEARIINEIESLIDVVRLQKKNMIFITNEVGFGLVPEYRLGRAFRDIAGNVNKRIASLSDEVVLMVSGIPLKVKGN